MRKPLIFIGIVLVGIAFADFNDAKTYGLDVAEIIGTFIGRELPYWAGGMYCILFGLPKSKWRTGSLWTLTILIILFLALILLSF
jgi:hypothetical protein